MYLFHCIQGHLITNWHPYPPSAKVSVKWQSQRRRWKVHLPATSRSYQRMLWHPLQPSSPSQHSAYEIRTFRSTGNAGACYWAYFEFNRLAEQLGIHTFNHDKHTANWLSEEMIKCISAIY
ncbi:hypothetical protein Nepgr_004581 [Nepenthes gracilis]|uniref:Uncharacterized protein n=1 Tax=Nepenthes gracilis TaxID=150966 RepID=A0AAD3XFE3_NEPGR|nr:hypothetical protein Nepgr_004581 [Nepenthes gracilis]